MQTRCIATGRVLRRFALCPVSRPDLSSYEVVVLSVGRPASMHLAGAYDNEEILSLRSGSLPFPVTFTSRHRNVKRHGRMYSDVTDADGGSFDRASSFALEKLEIASLLSGAASAGASPVSDGERSRSGTPSSTRSGTDKCKRFAT